MIAIIALVVGLCALGGVGYIFLGVLPKIKVGMEELGAGLTNWR